MPGLSSAKPAPLHTTAWPAALGASTLVGRVSLSGVWPGCGRCARCHGTVRQLRCALFFFFFF